MIDSHAHIISDDPDRYPPAPADGVVKAADLVDPMTVERLLAEMDRCNVERAVLVQRGSLYGFDNRYVCDSASRFPDRLATVCSIDGAAPKGSDAVRHWVQERGAAGIRLMELIRGSDLSWLSSPQALEVWRAADALRTPVCVHFFPWNRTEGLKALRLILEELPELDVVVDHFSNMDWSQGAPDYGLDDLLGQVAAFAGVRTKFTTIPLGRIDDAGVEAPPIVKRVVDVFGPERVMWGSDITQSKGSYEYMAELGRRAVSELSPEQQRQVLETSVSSTYNAWRNIDP